MFLLVALVAGVVVSILAARHLRAQSKPSGPATGSAVVLGLLALVIAVLSMTAIVPTREIGVVTSFGRPIDVWSNGLHVKAPWQKVNKLDGTIQTDNFTGADRAIDIRIGNGSTSGVDATIRWRIRLDAGKELYQDYRQMENIRDSLVTRELKAALNEVLGDYDPLVSVKAGIGSDGATTSAGVDLNAYSQQVHEALSKRVGEDVEVLSVILPIIRFDQQTQEKINAYQAEVANTRIAEQREATAKAQAQANKNLAGSVSRDPNVLVSKCLDALEEMVKAGQNVPIGFSCWPGSGGTSVVVPQAGAPAKN
ncbi:SPFH domain-containing protein [Aeromicrobium flavum]|nr:SPFH domain-containing protein [Aeromicrobium flavum]